MQVFKHWVIGTWKSLYQKLVIPTPFEDGKESEERGRHQTSQENRSEMLVCASFGVHPCSTKSSHDPESKDSTMSYLKFLRLTGQSLGIVELYSFSLSKFCPKGFSC